MQNMQNTIILVIRGYFHLLSSLEQTKRFFEFGKWGKIEAFVKSQTIPGRTSWGLLLARMVSTNAFIVPIVF